MIDASPFVHELLRALRERMTDSQSNLKPIAASLIADCVFSLDQSSAAKYFKVGALSLLSAAITDNKKPMREAAFAALDKCTKVNHSPDIVNTSVIQNLLPPLLSSLKDDAKKGGVGLAEALNFVRERCEHFAKFNPSTSNTKTQQMEQTLTAELLASMCSAKSDVRAAGEKLLQAFVEGEVTTSESVFREVGKLKPAQQRDVGALVSKFAKNPTSSASAKPAPSEPKTRATRKSSSVTNSPIKKSRPSAATTAAAAAPSEVDPAPMSGSSHPFFGGAHVTSYIGKEQRVSSLYRKKENWPDFPELPDNLLFTTTFKKNWSPLLSPAAVAAFFPASGMKKQDNSIPGCEVISAAIDYEVSSALVASHIQDQLDLILKFLASAFCSKENSSGLDSLTSTLSKLLDFVIDNGYELHDVEARCIIPILVEKSAVAKGRFVERFSTILSKFKSVVQPKVMGTICVNVVDFSKNQKARGAALVQLKSCVDKGGIQTVGKKGLVTVAKGLDDSGTDVRSASLAIIEAIVVKHGFDANKLARLLGSNLSARGKSLILERVKRLEENWPLEAAQTSDAPATRTTPQKRKASTTTVATPSSARRGSLDLKIGKQSMLSSPFVDSSIDFGAIDEADGGPFKFNNVVKTSVALTPQRRRRSSMGADETSGNDVEDKAESPMPFVPSPAGGADEDASVGGAASLRARLAAIRRKTTEGSSASTEAVDKTAAAIASATASVAEASKSAGIVLAAGEKEVGEEGEEEEEEEEAMKVYSLDACRRDVEKIFETPSQLDDSDPNFIAAKDALKVIHASFSQAQDPAFKAVYDSFFSSLDTNLDLLSKAFEVGLTACDEVCTSFVSIALASMMHVFKNKHFKSVKDSALTALVGTCCRSLLHSRLNDVTEGEKVGLTEEKQQQLVKAINKVRLYEERSDELETLALWPNPRRLVKILVPHPSPFYDSLRSSQLTIQCAVASSRTTSIQALFQLHLNLEEKDVKLKKVVAKLVARVMKAESTAMGKNSFGLMEKSPACDIEAVICCLEDFMTSGGGSEECKKLGKGLLLGIVGDGAARKEREARLREILSDLDFDKDTMSVKLLNECMVTKEDGGDVVVTEVSDGWSEATAKELYRLPT